MKMPTTKRRRWAVPREQLAPVEATIARLFGLTADTSRLADGEQAELVELQRKLSTKHGGINFNQLGARERKRFEQLVEKTADQPGHFTQARQDGKLRRDLDRLAERAARPAPPARLEAPGTVVLPPDIFAALRARELDAVDLLTLVCVVAQVQAGPFERRQAQLADGKLVVGRGSFLAPIEGDAPVKGVSFSFDRLLAGRWITVEQRGQGKIAVAFGERLREAFAARERSA